AGLPGGALEVGPIVQLRPVQLSANRLIEPSGIGPSGTREAPPPMLRPPQVRFLMTALLASSVLPQNAPPPEPVVKSRNAPTGNMVVVVEVDVEVVVVEVVVVVGPHAGSVGSVQEQSVVLQLRRTALLHALRAMPFKPAHPAAISSEQTFLLHGPVAVATEETKTPAPRATAANVNTALTVIVEPPL